MPTPLERLTRFVRDLVKTAPSPRSRGRSGSAPTPTAAPAPAPKPGRQPSGAVPPAASAAPGIPGARVPYPGDATELPDTPYSPKPDGRPDPGEIVWTWVPYEEDHTKGKDRPVLVVGRDGDWLVGLALTSKDHDRDEQQERRSGREWVDIGTGDWDRKGRPSEVRVNRLIRVDPSAVRREGAVLPRDRYDAVVAGARAVRGR